MATKTTGLVSHGQWPYSLSVPFLQPTYILAILIALSVHECAHAWMADRLGDPTARMLGRRTLNPIAHLDPLGSILFLVIGFGWGKPVPVDPRYFRHPKRDSALVALAGPMSNLLLAILSFMGFFFVVGDAGSHSLTSYLMAEGGSAPVLTLFLTKFFAGSLFVNLTLMAFNLLPVAPLDGSKIIQPFVPLRFDDLYEEFLRRGPFILLGLLIAERFLGVPLLFTWISTIAEGVLSVLFLLFAVR